MAVIIRPGQPLPRSSWVKVVHGLPDRSAGHVAVFVVGHARAVSGSPSFPTRVRCKVPLSSYSRVVSRSWPVPPLRLADHVAMTVVCVRGDHAVFIFRARAQMKHRVVRVADLTAVRIRHPDESAPFIEKLARNPTGRIGDGNAPAVFRNPP